MRAPAFVQFPLFALTSLWRGRRQDEPRFEHRGVLLDSGRNFLDLPALFRAIDGLAANKMNVLHWHIYDAQSFPLTVPALPALTDGAYSVDEIYSVQDIRDIVNYGYMRGVRIVPEYGMVNCAC